MSSTGNATGMDTGAPKVATRDVAAGPANTSSDLPPEVRQLAETVSHHLALFMAIQDFVPIRGVALDVLETLPPRARVRMANKVSDAYGRCVQLKKTNPTVDTVEAADERLIGLLETRHVDLKIVPES